VAAEEQMYALAKFIVGNSCVGSLKLTKLGNPDILRKIVLGLALHAPGQACHARVGNSARENVMVDWMDYWENIL